MLKFAEYMIEAKNNRGGLSKNEYGKLHEVLLGGLVNHYAKTYQDNVAKFGHKKAHEMAINAITSPNKIKKSHKIDIEHMAQFKDDKNRSAGDIHNEYGDKLSPEDYQNSYDHALHGATELINHLHKNGITDLKKVHFTANAGDIQKLTGQEDKSNNSDVVVEHGHKKIGGGYYGISLKSGAESKLNNPGMGKLRNFLDQNYEAITGKKSKFGSQAEEAENNAKQAHQAVLNKYGDFLDYHFGGKGASAPGTMQKDKDGNIILKPEAFRYLEKANSVDSKYNSLYKHDEDKSIFGKMYNEMADSRLNQGKRPTGDSFATHLSDIMKYQSDPKKGPMVKEFLKKMFNVKRDPSLMPVKRLNTYLNNATEAKKTGNARTSIISDAEQDFDNHYNRSNGNYEVRHTPGSISSDLVSPTGHKVSMVIDSSPAGGGSMVTRNGVHFWDKSKEVPTTAQTTVPAVTTLSPKKKKPTRMSSNEDQARIDAMANEGGREPPIKSSNEMWGQKFHSDDERRKV
jgi:hypothetical protein